MKYSTRWNTDKVNIDWTQTIRNKVRGIANFDLGEVQEIEQDHIITRKGLVDIDEFYLPKDLLERYDGRCLWFNIEKRDAQLFKRGL